MAAPSVRPVVSSHHTPLWLMAGLLVLIAVVAPWLVSQALPSTGSEALMEPASLVPPVAHLHPAAHPAAHRGVHFRLPQQVI